MTLRIVSFAATSALVVACSLIVENGASQCDTTADCANRGGPFADTICSADHTCVSRVLDGGVGDSDTPEAGPECATNADCITKANGAAAICRKDSRKCVTLLNADCDSVRGFSPTGTTLEGADAVRNDDTIVLGTLLSLRDTADNRNANAAKNVARQQAVELAVSEIMTQAAGLPPAAGSDKRRAVAVLSCNDFDVASPAPPEPAPTRAAKHFLDVGAPAVIGAGDSGNTIATVPSLAKKGVLLIAPSATAPSLTTQDDDGLFWRTAPSDALQAVALARRVMDKAGTGGGKRIAFLYRNDAYGQGLFDRSVPLITRNGVPITAPANASVFRARAYDAAPTADLSSTIAELYAFKPDVLVILGTGEGVSKLLVPIEEGWNGPSGPGNGVHRPEYVASDGLKANNLIAAIVKDEGKDGAHSDLRGRVDGTAPGRPNATTNSFLFRFEPKYTNANSTAFGTAGAYDAAYVILYGIAASVSKPLTGKTIADGIGKLVGGSTKVDVGPNGVNDAFQRLAAGSAIDLNGASSPLTFDLTTGESPADIEVWCIPSSANPPAFKSSNLYYDSTREEMVGNIGGSCN